VKVRAWVPLLAALAGGCFGETPLDFREAAWQPAPIRRPETVGPAPTLEPEELARLWRAAAAPGVRLGTAEHQRLEQSLRAVLPRLQGELAGFEFEVAYNDFETPDDLFSVRLVRPNSGDGDTLMWFQLTLRPAASWRERERFGPQVLGPYRGRGFTGEQLDLWVGEVVVRAVAVHPGFRTDDRLRGILERFDLEMIAAL